MEIAGTRFSIEGNSSEKATLEFMYDAAEYKEFA